jgi:hypothetical protein
MQLIHVPGMQMIQSDTISRIYYQDQDRSEEEKRILLPDALFVRTIKPDLLTGIRDASAKDTIVQDALAALQSNGTAPMRSSLQDWKTVDGIMTYQGRIYIPPDDDLRREVLRLHHDIPGASHSGRFKTFELTKREFWWPGLHQFVTRYVAGCAACQQGKINTHPTSPALIPIPVDSRAVPFSCPSIDFVTDLPVCEGYDSVMVVVDHDASRGMIPLPCKKTITAEETAQLYHWNIYPRFGLPDKVISDRGPQFSAKFTQELYRLLNIRPAMSTAYHPQTDSLTERTNQNLEAYLQIYCGNHPDTWVGALPDLEFSHNSRTSEATKHTPFQIMMGFHPRAYPAIVPPSNVPAAQEHLESLAQIRAEVLAALELSRQRMAQCTKDGSPSFKKGEQVWLEAKNLNTGHPSKKIAPKQYGPFDIIKVLGPVSYKLKLPPQWKIHPVFHACLLMRYRRTRCMVQISQDYHLILSMARNNGKWSQSFLTREREPVDGT